MAFPLINPVPTFLDGSGNPLDNGTLDTLNPADDTFRATYPTADDADALTNANSNPIVLNGRGEAPNGIYMPDGETVKLVLRDSLGAPIWTQDDVRSPSDFDTLTGAQVGAALYPQSTFESNQSITPAALNYPWGDVRRYGATGDGVTDDTAALEQAGRSGHTMLVPDGTYVVSNLAWTVDVDIRLDDGAVIQHQAAATDHMIESTARLVIRGGKLDGNKANQTGRYDAVNASGPEVIVENVHFLNTVQSGVDIDNVSGMARVADCYFTGMAEHTGVDGETTKCVDLNVAAQVVELVGNVCIADTPTATDVAPGGFFCSGTSQSVRITNNYFRNCGQSNGSNQISCIQLYTDADESIIANNICEDSYFSPIRSQNSSNVTMTGNVIRGYSGEALAEAMMLFGHARSFASAVINCTITGNTIDIAGNTTNIGIYITGDSAGVLSSYGVTVTGNVVEGGNNACRVEWFTDLTISNNSFRNQSGASSRGLLVNNLSDDRAIMNITSNIFMDSGNVFCSCVETSDNDNFSANITGNSFQIVSGTPSYFVQVNGESGALMERILISSNIGNGTCSSADFQVTWCDAVVLTHNNTTAATAGFSSGNNTLVREIGNTWQALTSWTTGAHANLRDFTGTTTASEALQLCETVVEDLVDQGILS